MTQQEKDIIFDIYKNIVKFAYSSHITSEIYKKYPEAFFRSRE